ncbi:MAG: hypothetical protein AAGC43_04625 [Bacteroidota bacterium]
MQLLTVLELAQKKQIGKKYDEKKAEEAIQQAQNVDLYDLLGNFYFDVLNNSLQAAYSPLLNGSTFTYNEKSYTHLGLKEVLADFAYARYINLVNANVTPFGMVTKLNQDSNPVPPQVIRDTVKNAQVDADVKFRIIRIYLEANRTTFERYFSGDKPKNIATFGTNFSVI